MIIVEGPDGAGKTTLIQYLTHELGIPVAPRVVAQDTTAMTDLKAWVEHNLKHEETLFIYDRYRLISETIYGPIMRDKPQPGFDDAGWMSEMMERFYNQTDPFIIYCLPDLNVVKSNIENDPDNQVVKANIEKIYQAYVARYAADTTHARAYVWDYKFSMSHRPTHRAGVTEPYFMPSLRRYLANLA